ncbi:uncharacterized protein PHALS_01380 [Plasmopara halstedii]|uniref:Uncharacterized protein n=1 Tax=Plasmopara halstedii TaxID=4781 RepID=A0A0P1ASQ9_PLAHL|nr:uncharacterized protein PHALS_01380 [Plasmopara halstedii]CEG45053.1 hypothetical protein PHALS_01380 [Plasmopara halstedii]|eukprot:XP_024581422.1 hypothetical protein PHALS_01380 [Plasmopara halstedii]
MANTGAEAKPSVIDVGVPAKLIIIDAEPADVKIYVFYPNLADLYFNLLASKVRQLTKFHIGIWLD